MGYSGGFDHYTENPGYRNSKQYAKSPLASNQISPVETSCNSSSSSSSQVLELANSNAPQYVQEPGHPNVYFLQDPTLLNPHHVQDQYQPQIRYNPEPVQPNTRYVHQRHSYHSRFSQGPDALQTQYLEEPNAFDNIHKGRKRKLGEAPLWDHVPEKSKIFPVVTEKAIDPMPTKRRSAFGGVFGKRNSAIAAH